MEDKKFHRLKESLQQAIDHAEGKRQDLRTTFLPKPPAAMEKSEIIALRENLNWSQAVFARALNVSVKTVQSWEYGFRQPSGAALKLLVIAKNEPKILLNY